VGVVGVRELARQLQDTFGPVDAAQLRQVTVVTVGAGGALTVSLGGVTVPAWSIGPAPCVGTTCWALRQGPVLLVLGSLGGSDTLTLGAAALAPRPGYGSAPTLVAAGTWWPAWQQVSGSNTFVGGSVLTTAEWARFHLDVWWTPSDATAGVVRLRALTNSRAPSSTLGAVGQPTVDVAAPGAADTLAVTRLVSDVATAAGDSLAFVGVERRGADVADTYGGSFRTVALVLTKAA
jgi:hypothetical protein